MIRFTWLQFRAQAILAAALLAVATVALAVTGAHLHYVWDATLGPCLAAHPAVARFGPGYAAAGQPCLGAFQAARAAYAPYAWLRDAAGIAVLAVPGLAGLFWGAPLITPELHDGTWRLAFTQSITRTRWVAVKLAVTGAASVAVAGMFSLLVTWWAAPLDQLDSLVGPANSGRFNPLLFSQRGIAPLGYAAFAFALGATAGVILRRTVPAMAVALAGLAGALLAVANWVRPHLEPAAHLALPIMPYIKSIPFSVGDGTGPSPSRPAHGGPPQALTLAVRASQPARHGAHYYASTGGRLPNVQNAWVFSDRLVDAAGHAPSSQFLAHTACVAPGAPSNTCLAELAASLHQLVTLQPASRYWAFQAYETVIFTAAALLLAWFCFWWVRRRLA